MRISGVGLAVSSGDEPIPWPLRDSAVSRRYRPVAPLAEMVHHALAECVARGPIVLASCNGRVSTADEDDWRTSFDLADVVNEQAARAAAERAEAIAAGRLVSPRSVEDRPVSRVIGRAVASAACASGMHALYLARALLAAGERDVTVLAVDIASPPAHDNFEALRMLTDEPTPYGERSSGFQLGEAAVAIRLSREDGIAFVGPILGHDLDGDDGIARCLARLFEHDLPRDPQAAARRLFAAARLADGLPSVAERRRPELVIGQGAGPVESDRAELAAIARHLPVDIPIATPLSTLGHTLGASSLLSIAAASAVYGANVADRDTVARAFGMLAARGQAIDGRPLGVRRADEFAYMVPADPLVVCRALGGACGAVIVGDVAEPARAIECAWGPKSAAPPVRDATLRRIAAEVDAQRPDEPPDILVVTLDAPLPPAARIGQRILPTSVLEMTPGFIPQLVARAWGFRGPALCLVGADPEPLLAALRATHDRVYRLAIRGMHERDVEWIPRG